MRLYSTIKTRTVAIENAIQNLDIPDTKNIAPFIFISDPHTKALTSSIFICFLLKKMSFGKLNTTADKTARKIPQFFIRSVMSGISGWQIFRYLWTQTTSRKRRDRLEKTLVPYNRILHKTSFGKFRGFLFFAKTRLEENKQCHKSVVAKTTI